MSAAGTRNIKGFVDQGRLQNSPHTARRDQTTVELD